MKNGWVKFAEQLKSPRLPTRSGMISADGRSFTLSPGKTPSHIVAEHNALYPHFNITADQVIRANGNLAPTKFQAGKVYKMPYNPFSNGMLKLLEWAFAEGKKQGLEIPDGM